MKPDLSARCFGRDVPKLAHRLDPMDDQIQLARGFGMVVAADGALNVKGEIGAATTDLIALGFLRATDLTSLKNVL